MSAESMSADRYRHPLPERYASRAMERIFAPAFRFGRWRRLWLALAEAQREVGLPIPVEALREMRAHLDDIDLERAARYECEFRHDVMAHLHAFGDAAPKARGILHLGATSAFVGDNTDLLQHREALRLIRYRIALAVEPLADFARRHRSVPTLAYTHFQPAQPTTVGKRATLWIQDLLMDLDEVEYRLDRLRLRGVRGTTGTQASFLQLCGGDHARVEALERAVCRRLGFERAYAVTGQTYPRKVDQAVLATLSGVASSLSKMANDVRLLSHLRELSEPFEARQVGSSAMPYKRNPMRSERISALARHIVTLSANSAVTAGAQWLERTLDDSANKRVTAPDAFMATDAILVLARNVAAGLQVNQAMVEANLAVHLPFMAMESLLMRASREGGDRQELHERIRRHAVRAGSDINEAKPNRLLEAVREDASLGISEGELKEWTDPSKLIGRAPEQVDAFLEGDARTALERVRRELDAQGGVEDEGIRV